MNQALAADPSERLPWLSDPAPAHSARAKRSRLPMLAVALGAAAAGAAGWALIDRSGVLAPDPVLVETVQLPPPVEARPLEVAPVAAAPVDDREALALAAAPSIKAAQPAPPPRLKAAKPRVKPTAARRKPAARPSAAATAASRARTIAAAKRSATYDPRTWNSGVQGRIIQLGAYRSQAQAIGQWNRVYYRYPLLRPLPPRVVQTRIRGRTYYRLQLGTFSHAHSEGLCQRLRAVGEGCIVLGLNRRGRRA